MITLLILQLLVFSFISWLLIKWVIRVSKRMSWIPSINKWIVIIYFGILLLSVFVHVLLPENEGKIITDSEIQQLQKENDAFEIAFRDGEAKKLDSKFLVDEWARELGGYTLNINTTHLNSIRPKVYVEWIDSKESEIEAKLYQTNINLYGINIDDKVPKIKIEWEDEQLIIKSPPSQDLNYYIFSNSFPILGILDFESAHNRIGAHGNTYIYLKVPKHINVVDETGLQFY